MFDCNDTSGGKKIFFCIKGSRSVKASVLKYGEGIVFFVKIFVYSQNYLKFLALFQLWQMFNAVGGKLTSQFSLHVVIFLIQVVLFKVSEQQLRNVLFFLLWALIFRKAPFFNLYGVLHNLKKSKKQKPLLIKIAGKLIFFSWALPDNGPTIIHKFVSLKQKGTNRKRKYSKLGFSSLKQHV